MKKTKHFIVFIAVVLTPVVIAPHINLDIRYALYILILTPSILIFNLILRKNLSFENYFTSRFNIFTAKYRKEIPFEITQDLMFEKVKEVVDGSRFKLVQVEADRHKLLAITSTTAMSWGENLYINIEPKKNGSLLKICSSTWFQVYAWGKNEENCNDLLSEIEESLIV